MGRGRGGFVGYPSNKVNKIHERYRMEKMLEEALNDPKYKAIRRKFYQEAVMEALGRFVIMACDFLEQKHNYGKRGFGNFCEFAIKRLQYTEENEKYYEEMHDYLIKKHSFDVLRSLGLEMVDSEEDRFDKGIW